LKVVDTSVAVDHLRGAPDAVQLLASLVIGGESLIASEVVRFELLAGVRDSEVESLERFFTAITWVPVDEGISRLAGRLARTHRRPHSGIDDADYLIAATALRFDAELLTVNVKHFPMLQSVRVAY
jgi:hypothetical protein